MTTDAIAAAPRGRTPAVPFILVTVLLDMLGIGIIVPVLPSLVTSMYGEGISAGSAVFGWFAASYALMQFVFSPVLGSLSDTYGRRPIILLSLFGAGLDYVLMAVAPTLSWLFLGRLISGITGASVTAANAYIADVSAPEQRGRNFGLVGACFGVGFVLGPALGGLLARSGLRAPFVAAAVLNLANALYGFMVLPESHPPERRRPFAWRQANPLGALAALRVHPAVFGLAGVVALERLAHDALPSTWVLYTIYRFQWSELEVGLSLALVGIMSVIVSAGLTGWLIARWQERRALLVGLLVGVGSFVAYGLATSGWMLYVTIVAGSLGAIAGPAMQALITRRVAAGEQGAVQGALSSVRGITGIVAPLMATGLFGYFTSSAAPVRVPGAAFLVSAALLCGALGLAMRTLREPATFSDSR